MAESTQYHVTLRFPVAMKFSGAPFLVRCFDATIVEGDSQGHEFRVVRVWGHTLAESRKTTLQTFVPADNIAGLVAQPFDK